MASIDDSQLVLVTGALGYLASHIIKLLQEEGYKVRGTVRSLENAEKVQWLKDLCPDAQYPLELVEADLNAPDSWKDAVKDCAFVIHVASPFPKGPVANAEEEVIKPAVEGTKTVLQNCAESGTVRRVILTSSSVAVHGEPIAEEGKVYSEADWSNCENQTLDAYVQSKTLAEKAAWDFVKELSDDQKFELAVINPVLILGPVLSGSYGTSVEVIKRLMERSMPAVPKINFSVCDVRDVALAHYKAMTMPDAVDHRHIISSGNMWYKEIAQILAKEFKPQGYSIPTMNCPYFALWVTGLFDKTIKTVLPRVGKEIKFDNTRMKSTLEIEPREISSTLIDMAYSLIDHGIVKKTKKYKGKKKDTETEGEENEEEKEKVVNGDEKVNGEIETKEEEEEDDLKKEKEEIKAEDKEGQGDEAEEGNNKNEEENTTSDNPEEKKIADEIEGEK